MIPDIIRPYLDHPLVKSKKESDLEVLDSQGLNNIIRAEDQIIRGVREYYLDKTKSESGRLTPSQFSSSILLARGLAFLDVAHYKQNVSDIYNDVWDITPTTAKRASFNTNMRDSIMPRLEDGGLVEFDASKQSIVNYVPYPVGSKLFVQKNLVENTKLMMEQANHYQIINTIQDFPELTTTIEAKAPQSQYFKRDFTALSEIDILRVQEMRGRQFAFSKGFLTSEKASEKWLQVLDTADTARVALKSILDLQGIYGGFISHEEIVKATEWNSRGVNSLIRHIDNLGIAQSTHTLDMKDALSRPTTGTLLNMNYLELNNAESILSFAREVPETIDILNKLRTHNQISEDELLDQYEIAPTQRVRNTLKTIGLIRADRLSDAIWELVPFRGNDKFISDVLTVAAHSRHVLAPDYDPTGILKDNFKKLDEAKLRKETDQMKLDFFKIFEEEEVKK